VPSSSPIQLNTDFFNNFIPGIVSKYGSNKPVDLICTGQNNPVVTLNAPASGKTSGDLDGKLITSCAVDVRSEGVAVDLVIDLSLDAGIYEADWEIKGTVNTVSINSITAKNVTVTGPVDTSGLESTLNFVITLFLPTINQ
jgi:hypothetical protein